MAVTLQQLARAAGLSTATVSRALRNDPRHSEKTRRRVHELSRKMGYLPNPLVATLMSQVRTRHVGETKGKIAFLTAFQNRIEQLAEFPHSLYFRDVREQARLCGYEVEHFWTREPGVSHQRLSSILRARDISGVIVALMPTPSWRIELEWGHFATACIGYVSQTVPLHRASNHQYLSMSAAMKALAQRGYARIGLCLDDALDHRILHQFHAYYLADQKRSHPGVEIPVLTVPHFDSDRPKIRRWIRRYKPDAVITPFRDMIGWLAGEGIRVPDDLAVAITDVPPELAGIVAGIDQRHDLVGRAAVDLVVEQLHRNERGIPVYPKYSLVEGVWVDGATVGRASGSERGRRRPTAQDRQS